MLELLARTYHLSAPTEIPPERAQGVVSAAVERARAKHPDFDRFLPGIEFLSGCVFTDHKRMPIDDYLETLYCAVKHGDFSRSWRVALKREK